MRVYYKFGVPISRVQAQYACEESRRAGSTVWQALCAADGIERAEVDMEGKHLRIEVNGLDPLDVEELLEDEGIFAG